MIIKDVLDTLNDIKLRINPNDKLTSKLVKFIKTEIEAQLITGTKIIEQYKPSTTIEKALQNHKLLNIILANNKPLIVMADKKINGINALKEWSEKNPEKISHLDYMVLDKLDKHFSTRKKNIYWNELKPLVSKKSKIIFSQGIITLEGINATDRTTETNTD